MSETVRWFEQEIDTLQGTTFYETERLLWQAVRVLGAGIAGRDGFELADLGLSEDRMEQHTLTVAELVETACRLGCRLTIAIEPAAFGMVREKSDKESDTPT